jgi:hypothetical protein
MGGAAENGRRGAGGRRLRQMLRRRGWALALLGGALLLPGRALAGELAPAGSGGPVELSAAQLDSITSGSAISLQVDLAAFAAGSGAVATTLARTQIVQSQLLVATVDPGAPEEGQMRDVAQRRANIAMGSGLATAAGQSDAHCSATMTVIGEIDFSRSMSTALASASAAGPSSAVCQCSIIAISLMK